jgi:diadenosine tetraphosphate (Ap4A) HIT family hydrolase
MSGHADCRLCAATDAEPVYRDDLLRVVPVNDADLPGYLRVIVNAHVKEMTDLSPADRARVMAAVYAAETAQRTVLAPAKINLASFGNQVPHLHWHVIPRFADDAFFPGAIWAPRLRDTPDAVLMARRARLPQLAAAIRAALPAAAA